MKNDIILNPYFYNNDIISTWGNKYETHISKKGSEEYNLILKKFGEDVLYTNSPKNTNPYEFDNVLIKTIDLIYNLNNFSNIEIDRFLDSLHYQQYLSRKIIYDILKKHPKKYKNICVLAGWYGTWISFFLKKLYPECTITIIDIDESLPEISKQLFKRLNFDVKFKKSDIFEYIKSDAFEQHDLTINCACEHMDDMKNAILNKTCDFVLQSTSNKDCEGHINCKNSLNEFLDSVGLNVFEMNSTYLERGERHTIYGNMK